MNSSGLSNPYEKYKMTTTVPISELKQRTGSVLSKAVVGREDVIIERYGQEYAVVISRERYQQLIDAARARVKERFLEAQKAVYDVTAEIPQEEIEEIVDETVRESRRQRAGLDEGRP
jgi:prevent-host-death family protein